VHILSQFCEDKASFKISTSMGKIFKVTVKVPEKTSEYIVGEKEKDFMVKALEKYDISVEELSLDSHSDDLNMSTPTSLNIPEI
jgi:hypothetical protein